MAVVALSVLSAAKTVVELKDAQGKSVGTAVLSEHDPAGGVEIELRPVFEAADFGAQLTPDLQAREEALRKRIEERKAA